LWGIEKELCRRDPETYDYVRKPPATAVPKKSKKARPLSSGVVDGGGRRSFVEEERRGKRVSSAAVGPPMGEKRAMSRVRERPRSFDERSSVVRTDMPHRREKDKAWWEGVSLSGSGPDNGRGSGRDRDTHRERDRNRRRSGGVV
jgi:hypothetical protein